MAELKQTIFVNTLSANGLTTPSKSGYCQTGKKEKKEKSYVIYKR